MSASSLFSLDRVLKPEGKHVMNASRRYLRSSSGLSEGNRNRNSSSMFSPRSWRARSASVRWRGRRVPVMLFRRVLGLEVRVKI